MDESTSSVSQRANPSYVAVFLMFARNSLIRDMTFRGNFLIESLTSLTWMGMNLGYYLLIYQFTGGIGDWGKYQFLIFLATTHFINSLVQAFFMPNAEEFSELVRTGGLDFALVKPIDTQFLISLRRVDWSQVADFFFALAMLGYSLSRLEHWPSVAQVALYPVYILCGVAILYSLMIALAASTIWLGRNQTVYEFWWYLTSFSRYPKEIYQGTIGTPLGWTLTYILPLLLVTNVPARLMAKPLAVQSWPLAVFTILVSALMFWLSRQFFRRALWSYRSASS